MNLSLSVIRTTASDSNIGSTANLIGAKSCWSQVRNDELIAAVYTNCVMDNGRFLHCHNNKCKSVQDRDIKCRKT